MNIIDAHHHFWNPARGDYGWMSPDNEILYRPYGPADLAPARTACNVTQTVLVQAAPSVEETEYMLGIADATPHVGKVVGWIDFEDASQRSQLERLSRHPKFSGVRPMVQDIEDDDWLLRDDIQWAFEAITELDLTFDCLGFPKHLTNFRTILTRYAGMRTVIDHCMKPQLRDATQGNFSHWADGMQRIAEETKACCKISGLVTEGDTSAQWSVTAIQPYTDHLIAVFGPDRLMFGSDWPVVRLRCEYEDWVERARELTAGLTEADRDKIFSSTAAHFYRL